MDAAQSVCRFILLPSFVGLVCYSCGTPVVRVPEEVSSVSSSRASIDQAIDTVPAAEPAAELGLESAKPDIAAYDQGINLASSAYQLSRSALSPDDWSLVASRWQQAADQLKRVTAADEHHKIAQQKIAEYTRSADYAAERIVALQQSVPIARPSAAQPVPVSSNVSTGVATNVSPRRVSVPIVRRLHGTPVVKVTFDGVRSYEMILDTGASRTLITRQMANDLGIAPTDRMVAATASQAEVVFDIGQVRSISMGAVIIQNVSVGIGDSVEIGLLGNDFLRGHDITIRTRDNVVELAAVD